MDSQEKKNDVVVMPSGSTAMMNRESVFLNPAKFEQLQRACQALAASDLVPEMYKIGGKVGNGQPQTKEKAIANCVIALDMADRMGANPLMIMQNMYIVYGRPSWSSAFLIATVNSCGRFKSLKFQHAENGTIEIGGRQMPNLTCYAYTSEKSNDDVLRGATISLQMAKAEGWMGKNGSKWMTMPEQMLVYRAAAFWVRTYAPEISMGIYTAEENEDIQTAHVIETRFPKQRTKVDIDIPPTEEEQRTKPADQPAQEQNSHLAETERQDTNEEECGY